MRRCSAVLFAILSTTIVLSRADALVQRGYMTTVAGTGLAGAGLDGPAADSALENPVGLTFDSAGDLYIADTENSRVQKVDAGGNITTIAGTGIQGAGSDGPVGSSDLDDPRDIKFDSNGNLYIVDSRNHRIRMVDTGGTITTIAGTGVFGTGGDGPATSSALFRPRSIELDSAGNLYIADTYNHRIQLVTPSGNVTTIAGTGLPGLGIDGPATASALDRPRDVEFGPDGNLYIADTYNHRVQMMTPSGSVTTVAGTGAQGDGGDGLATTIALHFPTALAFDPAGNLFIADTGNSRIRMVDNAGYATSIAGTGVAEPGEDGPALNGGLNRPHGITFGPDGHLYVADTGNHQVRRIVFDNNVPAVTTSDNPFRVGDGSRIAYTCTDAGGTGLDACEATLNGQPAFVGQTLLQRGVYALTVTAVDNAGNETTETTTFLLAGKRELTGNYANSSGQQAAIARIYMATLARDPDDAGYAYWSSRLHDGTTLHAIAEQFVSSPEFRAWQGTLSDQDFVERLYDHVLVRPSEPEGLNYWLGRLHSGMTRAEMLVWFSQSPEFKAITYTD